jgi:peptidoglycan/xylan/chitin deacetylase (PgdA/CDA1 family)
MNNVIDKTKINLSIGKVLKKGDWPNEAKCALSFSFSMHAPWYPLAMKLGQKGILASENMTLIGLERILHLFKQYDIKSTFWVISYLVEKYPEIFRRVHDLGHEIGNFGYLRQYNTIEELKVETDKSNKIIEEIIGERPIGIKLLSFDAESIKIAVEKGFIYDGGFAGHEIPFEINIEDKRSGLISLPLYKEMDDFMHVGYIPPDRKLWFPIRHLISPNLVYDLWKAEFDGCYKEGLFLASLFHPEIVGRASHAITLEKFIRYIKSHSKVWIAPLGDVARWTKSRL